MMILLYITMIHVNHHFQNSFISVLFGTLLIVAKLDDVFFIDSYPKTNTVMNK